MTSPPPLRDLGLLLASMQPVLNPGVWAWCARPLGEDAVEGRPPGMPPVDAVFTLREPEGRTVVVVESDAQARGWPVAFRAAWITLRVHSDLEAVGLTAAFSRALGDAGISCNVVAGVHHDHLFVPIDRADDALRALNALQAAGHAPAG